MPATESPMPTPSPAHASIGASFTLSPTGIGDEEYPASGKLALGGKEIVSFTRSGDTVSITRAQSNTEATTHDEGDRAQVVLEYSAEAVHDIIYDLITNYTEADPVWIDYAAWESEGLTISPLYSAQIAEPTPVRVLINELIEQCGLVMWWDAMDMQIRLESLRPVAPGSQILDESVMMRDSFSVTACAEASRSGRTATSDQGWVATAGGGFWACACSASAAARSSGEGSRIGGRNSSSGALLAAALARAPRDSCMRTPFGVAFTLAQGSWSV